jgi:competence protein ComGC
MANDDDNEYGNLVKNFFVSMLILMSMLSVLPAIFYGFTVKSKGDTQNSELIDKYRISSEDLDIFNTFEELYLFCTYIPIRRVKICGDDDKHSLFLYNKALKEASDVKELLSTLYKNSKLGGEKSKKDAADAIAREKEKREQREQEEMLANKREAGENSRNNSNLWLGWTALIIAVIGPSITNLGIFVNAVIGRVMDVFRLLLPIITALASNRVFVGFIILVIIISIIFGLLKPKDKVKNKKKRGAGEEGFSIYSLWEDIVETYEYYRDMIRNFKMSSMTGGLIADDEENAANDEKNGLVINRKTLDGKSYDNLSYVMLSDIFNKNEIKEYYGKSAVMENGRYYNIHLPDERFKKDMPSSVKWVVSDGAKQNEKVWRIDCEKLDTLNNKSLGDGSAPTAILPAIPAFIKKGDKCVINTRGLDKINKPPPVETEEDIPFKTEYIR